MADRASAKLQMCYETSIIVGANLVFAMSGQRQALPLQVSE